jgi:thiosulfate/3-mercaptopyruvate sulfurtransferase
MTLQPGPPPPTLPPSTRPPSPLISAAELAARISRPGLLVVDCRFELSDTTRGHSDYLAGHIPGAVYANLDRQLSAPRTRGSGRHPLPTAAAFAWTLGEWGWTPDTLVVAYDSGNGAMASRLWWLLRARGESRVQVLDGGFTAWRAAGHPVETALPFTLPTRVAVEPFRGALDSEGVQAGLARHTIALVDARTADRFAGQNETLDPIAGRVPGSVNHPFARNLGTDGRFLDAAALRERWQPILEAAGGKPLVAMCGSGVTACHNLLALDLIGHPGQLYAGSFSEWIADPARPVATGAP